MSKTEPNRKTNFERGDKVCCSGSPKRGHVEGFDDLAGTFTITWEGGHVTAALGIDLELAEPRKSKPPKHGR